MSAQDVSTQFQTITPVAPQPPQFEVRLAQTPAEHRAGHALRYRVFVKELGAQVPEHVHKSQLERDQFDEVADQLLLFDHTRTEGDRVVGVYRVMDEAAAQAAGGFYSAAEFDLSPLLASGRPLIELGRSCVHEDYRGGSAVLHLWQGLAQIVEGRGAEIVFGAASFPGTDLDALRQPLSLLRQDYLAPKEVRVRSCADPLSFSVSHIDRVAAMAQVPPLIKAYLRLGGVVGDGVFVDQAFNTTDLCLILDVARMTPRQRARFTGAHAA